MQACSTTISAVSQLLVNYLSSTANSIVAEELYDAKTTSSIPNIFIHRLN